MRSTFMLQSCTESYRHKGACLLYFLKCSTCTSSFLSLSLGCCFFVLKLRSAGLINLISQYMTEKYFCWCFLWCLRRPDCLGGSATSTRSCCYYWVDRSVLMSTFPLTEPWHDGKIPHAWYGPSKQPHEAQIIKMSCLTRKMLCSTYKESDKQTNK